MMPLGKKKCAANRRKQTASSDRKQAKRRQYYSRENKQIKDNAYIGINFEATPLINPLI